MQAKAPDKEKKSGRILTRTCCAKEACRKARLFRSGIRANGIGEERAGQSIVKGKKGKITALPDLLNVKKRPKSSAIRNIAYIERHKICPGGRLFRIWDENSHCYCTGIIYQEKKSRFYITALRRGVRREKKQHRRLVKRSGYGKGADERRFRQVLCVFPTWCTIAIR